MTLAIPPQWHHFSIWVVPTLWILPKFSAIPPFGFSVKTDPPFCSPKNQVIPLNSHPPNPTPPPPDMPFLWCMYKTLLPDVNVPVGVSHVGEMVFIAVGTTWIMGRPISGLGTSFKVVIFLQPSRTLRPKQIRAQAGAGWVSSRHKLNCVRNIVQTFGRNVLYVSTQDFTTFKLHQTSALFPVR